MNAILSWILNNFPWLAPSIAIAFLAWKISRWTKVMEDAKKKIDAAPCALHKDTINNNKQELDKEILKTNDSIKELTHRLTSIEAKFDRWDNKMIDLALASAASAKKSSPYSLTDMGKILLSNSSGDKCIDNNKEYYFDKINNYPHATPFDVERAAINVVLDSFNLDITNDVKNFIYNSPNTIQVAGKENTFTINDIQVGMAIYLRDLYIQEHKNLFQKP